MGTEFVGVRDFVCFSLLFVFDVLVGFCLFVWGVVCLFVFAWGQRDGVYFCSVNELKTQVSVSGSQTLALGLQ